MHRGKNGLHRDGTAFQCKNALFTGVFIKPVRITKEGVGRQPLE